MPSGMRRGAGLAVLAVLTTVIAVVDTITPREIAAAGFYVIVVLLAFRLVARRGVLLVAGGCALLTSMSFLLNESGARGSGVINLAICLAGIAVTTYLGLRMEQANAEAQRTRASLAHATRISVLGELTASIAHEVNQPLTGVVTSAQAARRWLGADAPNIPRAIASVERAVSDAQRASEIIAHVRRLAEPAPPRKEWTDINQVVHGALALTRRETAESAIQVIADLATRLPKVRVDRVQMQQVLINLLMNAIEAIRITPGDTRQIVVRTGRSADGAILVSVRDSGPGLGTRDVDRLFEAFYTTKQGGMGIGLAITRTIVEAHGGTVSAASLENGHGPGSVFQFELPVTGYRE